MQGKTSRAVRSAVAFVVIPAVVAVLAACLTTSTAFARGLNGDPNYTSGPDVCGGCHPDAYTDWLSHGHSRKLAGGVWLDEMLGSQYGLTTDARLAGFMLPDHDTDVYNWSNILFVVGGSKHWKTRYVGLDGYLLTKNGQNQYNWENGSFSDYHTDEVKPFSCGSCHTTGYNPAGTAFETRAPGIEGDFAQFNVTCEACHGPGQAHAESGNPADITIDTSPALCGQCHTRGSDPNIIIAQNGFIRHHEQYPEFNNSPHSAMSCGSCHDPHVGRAKGVKVLPGNSEVCETCHAAQAAEYVGSSMEQAGVRCQDCHMGKATKSAIANGPYEGDVWTHIFRIDSSSGYWMFYDGDTKAYGALSLEFACFRCHADASKLDYANIGSTGSAYHTIGD
jgi:hypothetical protein